MDSSFSNKRYAEDLKVTFPLLSDWNRTVVKDYGVYDEKSGYARRTTFVVDKEGIIQSIEEGNTAIDPTGAYEVCDLMMKKKSKSQ